MTSLWDKVCSLSNLSAAWRHVRAKKAAGGLDHVTVTDYERELDQDLKALSKELWKGTYAPEPYKRISVPKLDGKGEKRSLSLPVIRDKIAQQAVRQVIEPLFEKIFLPCSYAYRHGKGPGRAYRKIHHFLRMEKRRWVALADFDNFFDSLDQDILMNEVHKRVDDFNILRLVRMWNTIGSVNPRGNYEEMPRGIGQGSIISPLLSNIYAHPLDEYMTQRGYAYLRYSDNMIMLSFSQKEAQRALNDLTFYALEHLKLLLNQSSHPIRSVKRGFTFLGIYYREDLRAISTAKITKIKRKIDQIIRRFESSPNMLIVKLGEALDGFHRYYQVLDPEEQMIEIDQYVTKRLVPLLAGYVKKERYHSTRDLLNYLFPLPLLSREFKENQEERLREIVSQVLKQTLPSKGQGKTRKTRLSKILKSSVKSADRAVSRKKRNYLRRQALRSEIVVTTPGAFLGKRGNRIVVSCHGKTLLKDRLETVQGVLIAAHGVTISSNLIGTCGKKGVPLLFCDAFGSPYAMFLSPESPDIRLNLSQLEATRNGRGGDIAKRIVAGKIKNQLNLMKFYGRSRKHNHLFQEKLQAMEDEVEALRKKIEHISTEDPEMFRNELLSIEGRVAVSYWHLARILFEDSVDFPGRERRGARDVINSCLNYGYGILYGNVWRALILAKLNPYIGFLHVPQRNKPVLVFDMIEEFRSQAVDRAVFTMVTRDERLTVDPETGLLTDATKRKIIQNVMERLSSLVIYRRGRKTLLKDVITFQAKQLARCLAGSKPYKPFIGRY